MKKLNDFLGQIEQSIAALFLVITTTLAIFQVMNRHIFHWEIMGIGDLIVYSYVICLFFSFAHVAKEDQQTYVEVVPMKLGQLENKNIQKYYCMGLDLISIAVILTFLFPLYGAYRKAVKFPEWGTLITWFNQSWLVYLLFGVFVLGFFHMLVNFYYKHLAPGKKN